MGLSPAPPQTATAPSFVGKHKYIAGYRLKEHARRRQIQSGAPDDAIEATLRFGRTIKSKQIGTRQVKVLDRRGLRQARQAKLNVCTDFVGLGVVIDPGKRLIVTVDRRIDASCKSFRKFRG